MHILEKNGKYQKKEKQQWANNHHPKDQSILKNQELKTKY